jgi:hypothetical protein
MFIHFSNLANLRNSDTSKKFYRSYQFHAITPSSISHNLALAFNYNPNVGAGDEAHEQV